MASRPCFPKLLYMVVGKGAGEVRRMVRIVELMEEVELMEGVKSRFPHQKLRRYQADIANRVYESLSNSSRILLLEAPTGLGKRL